MSSVNPVLNPGVQWHVASIPGPLFDLLVKLPLVATDTSIALLLFLLLRNSHGESSVSVAALWFLNPFVIWVSSAWGMFDTLPALFTVLSLYLFSSNRLFYSGLTLAVATALKYYAAVLVIPLLVLSWKKKGREGLQESSIGIGLASAALLLPSLLNMNSSVLGIARTIPAIALHSSGLSFWTALTLFNQFAYQPAVSIVVLSFTLALFYWRISSASFEAGVRSEAIIFGTSILILLLSFWFVGENFFIWILPFAAIVAATDRTSKLLYCSLSLLALLSSITSSLLPYYFLPLAPWIGGFLASLLTIISPYRVAPTGVVVGGITIGKIFLASMGIAAAILLILLVLRWSQLWRLRIEGV